MTRTNYLSFLFLPVAGYWKPRKQWVRVCHGNSRTLLLAPFSCLSLCSVFEMTNRNNSRGLAGPASSFFHPPSLLSKVEIFHATLCLSSVCFWFGVIRGALLSVPQRQFTAVMFVELPSCVICSRWLGGGGYYCFGCGGEWVTRVWLVGILLTRSCGRC